MATRLKLNWKIIGRRPGPSVDMRDGRPVVETELVDVEWTHVDGDFIDTHIVPDTHPPNIMYRECIHQKRKVVKDQVSVPAGTPDSTVALILDGKRAQLAKNLNVAP